MVIIKKIEMDKYFEKIHNIREFLLSKISKWIQPNWELFLTNWIFLIGFPKKNPNNFSGHLLEIFLLYFEV